MSNPLGLIHGKRYRVKKAFKDFDKIDHLPGETWTFENTNFLPYEDGLTLHVRTEKQKEVYRLQWRPEEQKSLIERFLDFVEQVTESN